MRVNRPFINWERVPVILTSADACVLLGITDETLRKLAKKGEIPGVKIGRDWRFEKEQLMKLFRCETEVA